MWGAYKKAIIITCNNAICLVDETKRVMCSSIICRKYFLSLFSSNCQRKSRAVPTLASMHFSCQYNNHNTFSSCDKISRKREIRVENHQKYQVASVVALKCLQGPINMEHVLYLTCSAKGLKPVVMVSEESLFKVLLLLVM